MNPQLINALNDSKSDFGIVPSPKLKELIALDTHPVIQKLPATYKLTFMELPEGKCMLIDRRIVRRYVTGKSSEDEKFILDLCDIRMWIAKGQPPQAQ